MHGWIQEDTVTDMGTNGNIEGSEEGAGAWASQSGKEVPKEVVEADPPPVIHRSHCPLSHTPFI
jgi:hypothetical protein